MVRKTFGGQTDTVLNQSRRAFTDDIEKQNIRGMEKFPAVEINSEIKKYTEIGEDFVQDLLLTQKDSQYSFPLLALLYPHLDYKNNNFHQDHLHPETEFDQLSDSDKELFGWEVYNSICNLQMLDANENMSKNGSSLKSWIELQSDGYDLRQFLKSHLIPQNVSYDLADFKLFIETRKQLLVKKFKEILN